jgi:hypothetical protein
LALCHPRAVFFFFFFLSSDIWLRPPQALSPPSLKDMLNELVPKALLGVRADLLAVDLRKFHNNKSELMATTSD